MKQIITLEPISEKSKEPILQEDKAAFDIALSKHNAKNPNSQLFDVTDELAWAKSQRVMLLLLKHSGDNHPLVTDLTECMDELHVSAPEVYATLSLCGAIMATIRTYRRRHADFPWSEIEECLRNGGPIRTPKVSFYLKKMGRALRLLDRLVTISVVDLGEVKHDEQ